MTVSSMTCMIPGLRSAASPAFNLDDMERRCRLWIAVPFPAIVRGVDADRRAFEEHTVLDNLSACSLYLRLSRSVEAYTKLFVVAQLSIAPPDQMPAPHVALRGVVIWSESCSDGVYGIAMMFTHQRFLYARERALEL